MQTYLSILEELKEETEKTRTRSWKWMRFWQRDKSKDPQSNNDPEQEILITQNGSHQHETPARDIPELVMERKGSVWSGTRAERGARGFYGSMLHIARALERDDGNFPSPAFFVCRR